MTFDVVCGNPPYNNDIYIDFVTLGIRLSKSYCLWITPSKFWAKTTSDKDISFRQLHDKYGTDYVVYRDCKEIFNDISEPGGVAYYLLQKFKKVTTFNIECRHKNCLAFQSDWEIHNDLTFLPLSVLSILDKIGISDFKNKLNHNVSYFIDHTFNGSSDSRLPIKIFNGKTLTGYTSMDNIRHCQYINKYKCIQAHTCGSGAFQTDSTGRFLGQAPIYVLKENEVGRGFHHLKFFDTELEAKNFVAFMSTKLINFLYILGVCGTCNSKEFYRYIPDITDFSIKYTDDVVDTGTDVDGDGFYTNNLNEHCRSLYKMFNLTSDEINLVESTIRSR